MIITAVVVTVYSVFTISTIIDIIKNNRARNAKIYNLRG